MPATQRSGKSRNFTDEEIREIRELSAENTHHETIAEMFEVTRTTIRNIVERRTYRGVD